MATKVSLLEDIWITINTLFIKFETDFFLDTALAFWIAIELWIIFRERGQINNFEDKGSRKRIVSAILFSMVVCILMLPYRITPVFHSEYLASRIGSALICIGVLLRIWSVITLGNYFRSTVMIQRGHRFINSGPYRFVRHPSYTALLIIVVGVGMVANNLFAIIVMFLTAYWGVAQRVIVEESVMGEKFGKEYDGYRKCVKRFIPLI